MITPVLKGWDCTAHDPIDEWVPDEVAVVYWLACHIGSDKDPGEDIYTVPVVNHAGLKSPAWQQRSRRPRDVPPIVVEPYSWPATVSAVHELLDGAAAHDWRGVQERLRKSFLWEFDDYR